MFWFHRQNLWQTIPIKIYNISHTASKIIDACKETYTSLYDNVSQKMASLAI